MVSREESTDLGAQNSWCTELLVHTTIPPTFSKNNKGAPSARPTGARSAPVVVVFAECWWNCGAHQEFYAPRILYTKICALFSGHNISVVFGVVFGVLDVLGVLGVFGVLGVLGVFGVKGVLGILGASLLFQEQITPTV